MIQSINSDQEHKIKILSPVRKLSKVFSKFFRAKGNSESQLKQNIISFDENEEPLSASNQRRHTVSLQSDEKRRSEDIDIDM